MEPGQGDDKSHVPAPALLPIGFAIGLAVVLVGLIVSNWIAVGVGGAIAFVFGVLWVRDLSTRPRRGGRAAASAREAPPRPVRAASAATPRPGERYPRNRFLEGATLGLGAVIGGVVTVPPLGCSSPPASRARSSRTSTSARSRTSRTASS